MAMIAIVTSNSTRVKARLGLEVERIIKTLIASVSFSQLYVGREDDIKALRVVWLFSIFLSLDDQHFNPFAARHDLEIELIVKGPVQLFFVENELFVLQDRFNGQIETIG